VERLTLPLTADRRVDLIIIELGVIELSEQGLILKELTPGVEVEQVRAATAAPLRVTGPVQRMALA
jgi:acyl CoA:acetate/3-ketoacid CoA transferase beta subunit